MIKKSLPFVILFGFSFQLSAQSRIEPTKRYSAGDIFYSPLYGLEMKMPANCTGFLTRDTEVFTVNIDSLANWSIMMIPSKETLRSLKTRWLGGSELAPGIKATTDNIQDKSDHSIEANFTLSNDKNIVVEAYAECGDFGICYTMAVTIPLTEKHKVEQVIDNLVTSISFFEPNMSSLNDDFNWEDRLVGSYVFLYETGGGSMRKNQLWLCPDGSFKAEINRGGLLKNSTGKYTGKLKGKYTVEGVGATGKLTLSFKKLDTVVVSLKTENDLVYLNDIRHTVTNHRCK